MWLVWLCAADGHKLPRSATNVFPLLLPLFISLPFFLPCRKKIHLRLRITTSWLKLLKQMFVALI